ncbi:MAG: squalene synthase HpnC [Chloroflexi bacterium]|nr:squalene synthase HpnC [Chloroflexota bacterium]MCL5736592.1 squalene synthase HpnC [Actinomycetota bacterium]
MRLPGPASGVEIETIRAKAAHENFPVASWFLPKKTRRHMMAIYCFARKTDDLGDETGRDASTTLVLLDRWQSEFEGALEGFAADPVLAQVSRTIVECALDRRPFLDLIESNRRDQTVNRYDTFEDLRGYCRLSAEPVGRLVLAVNGVLTPERTRWSDDVCTGLQLTEHWQDIVEDMNRGRIYLPRQDMAEFGVTESDVLSSRMTPEFSGLMAFEVERARSLLLAVKPLARSVKGRLRLAIVGFAAGGLAALDAIEASGYNVFRNRLEGNKRGLVRNAIRLLGVRL